MFSIMNSEYAKLIFDLAENQTDQMFYNSSAEHAAIVHQALVKYASDYIDIFSGSLCSDISNNDEYCSLVNDFLSQKDNSKINIILTNFNDNFYDTKIFKIFSMHKDKVTIKKFYGQFKYEGKEAHFTISDDRSFRLETDVQNNMAFGNFNSSGQTLELKKFFDRTFNSDLVSSIDFLKC